MCWCLCVVFSRAQKSVTLSSTEAEYVAMADGLKKAIFLWYLWSVIFPDRDVECTVVKKDSVGALHMASNPVTTPNSKHMDIHSLPLHSGAYYKEEI